MVDDIPRVEILSPGLLKDGRRFFVVDLVETDGRAGLWLGTHYGEAILAAGKVAADELLVVVDRVVEDWARR